MPEYVYICFFCSAILPTCFFFTFQSGWIICKTLILVAATYICVIIVITFGIFFTSYLTIKIIIICAVVTMVMIILIVVTSPLVQGAPGVPGT